VLNRRHQPRRQGLGSSKSSRRRQQRDAAFRRTRNHPDERLAATSAPVDFERVQAAQRLPLLANERSISTLLKIHGAAIMSWFPRKCVIVPIDFSTASDEAIQTALEVTRRPEDVHVVHVAIVPDAIPYAGEVVWTAEPARWIQLAQQHLVEYLKSRPQFAGVNSKVLEGNAGSRIASFAAETQADLIVMPSHGYHGVKRFLLGSVTEVVLRHAPCEVLVLKRGD
jgi:nucleotide-binding universal stress UspA family protein